MLQKELILYLKNKINILIFLSLLIPLVLSYFDTYNEYTSRNFSVTPINVRTGGLSFFFSYLASEYYTVSAIAMLALLSCIIGLRIYKHLNDGLGNTIIVRSTVKRYLQNVLIAQSLYIVIIIVAFFTAVFLGSAICYPYKFNNGPLWGNLFAIKLYSINDCMLWLVLMVVPLLLYSIFVFAITSMSAVFFRNKYIIQTLPILIAIVPFGIGSIFQNFSEEIVILTRTIDIYDFLTSIYDLVEQPIGFGAPVEQRVANLIVLPIIFIIMASVLYKKNIATYEKDYV